jgi:hypothetical protein
MATAARLLPDPGTTEQANMEWLVRFLRTDIQAMTLHQLKDVLFDVRKIARLALSDRSQPFARWEIIKDEAVQPDIGGSQEFCVEWWLRKKLNDYQRTLKKSIGELSQHRRTVLHVSIAQIFGSVPLEIVTGRTHPALAVKEGTIDEVMLAFDFRLIFVLQACADRVSVCQRTDCAQVFLKTQRADQEYCSRRCGSAVRVQRKRTKDKAARLAKEAAEKKAKMRKHDKRVASQKGGKRHGTKRRQR